MEFGSIVIGGRMENKIKLKIGSLTDLNEISMVIVTSISCEYLIDTIRAWLRKYSRDLNLEKQISDFAQIIDESYDTSFTSFDNWLGDKSTAQMKMLAFVQNLDAFLVENGIIESKQLLNDFQEDYIKYLTSMMSMKITGEELDVGNLNINREYLNSAIEQLRLLDEGALIGNLSSMSLQFTPLDTQSATNKFVEQKLAKLDKLTRACNQKFDNDYDNLLNQILAMYQKFYAIAYSSDTDGEKSEKARKIIKSLNNHRGLLDSLENKLEEANELKRQLKIHETKITANVVDQKKVLSEQTFENVDSKEMANNQFNAKQFVASNYSARIEEEIIALTAIQEKISEHYKVLDQLEFSLKGAIPSEDEMARYSSIVHKFKELAVRLEMDKSKPDKPSKDLLLTINTAILGLRTLVEYANNFKDLYLRNSMLTAIFRAVNDLNDFATSNNKAEQLNQINFVANTLGKYNELNQTFSSNIVAYRKLANDTIRNISIIISKTINGINIYEVIELIKVVSKNFEDLYANLSTNNKRQVEIMQEIIRL